jgi:type VI secretion system protein ImpK
MHLTDCFMQLMAYVAYFLKTVARRQLPYEQVKADILRLLDQSESYVKKGLFSQEDYNLARFAVCAWVDEAILNSSWSQKSQWQKELLQRLFYQTTDAGEEFFEKVNSLGLHQREVREVYYLCLALGFTGRFINPGDETLLEHLKSSNLKLLLGSSVGLPSLESSELFPEAYPLQREAQTYAQRKWQVPVLTIVALAGPVVFFWLLFFVYRFTLSGMAENSLK